MKILFLARTLDCGGAERQLLLVANQLAKRHEVVIAVYYSGGLFENEVDCARVRLVPLSNRSRWDLLSFYWKLLRVVRRERPDVLHGWMSGPNLVATMVRFAYPKMCVFWGIRSSNLELIVDFDNGAKIVHWLERRFSRFADRIMVNSRAGLDHFACRGIPPEKMVHIPNGIDVHGLYPDAAAGDTLRTAWGFTRSDRVIGLVARLDPIKGHAVFLRAARRLAEELPHVCFVCQGDGPPQYKRALQALSRELGLEQKLLWVPQRLDMRAVYNALDVVCLSSLSEGFPNVIGEAMACGRHCVATDVGDSSFLLGDTGILVPPNDPDSLAKGLRHALTRCGNPNERGRQRILEHFTVIRLANRTEKVLLEFCREDQQADGGYVTPEPAGTHRRLPSDIAACGRSFR
jgi:glycosyltransferase involved in cell wall biosynthesis